MPRPPSTVFTPLTCRYLSVGKATRGWNPWRRDVDSSGHPQWHGIESYAAFGGRDTEQTEEIVMRSMR
jgi:hypothetical protein